MHDRIGAMTEVASRRPLTVVARLQSHVSPWGFVVEKWH
jgi:hypothetical protein